MRVTLSHDCNLLGKKSLDWEQASDGTGEDDPPAAVSVLQ